MDVHVPLGRCIFQDSAVRRQEECVELTRGRDEQSINRIRESLARNLTCVQCDIERELGDTDSSRVERITHPSFRASSQAKTTERVERDNLEHTHRRHADGAAHLGRSQ